jgi:hypothetical protein
LRIAKYLNQFRLFKILPTLNFLNEVLNNFFEIVSRNEVIEWLSWNDRNGVYDDAQSLKEFGIIKVRR